MIKKFLLAACCVFTSAMAQEFETFVVEDIRVEGLRRFSPGVIFSRLEVGVGDELSQEAAVEVIETLYETGYFRLVEVFRDGNVLVISINENPTIAEVSVNGADELSDEVVNAMLDSTGISKAKVFNRDVVDKATKTIEDFYVNRNFYHVKVEPVISPLSRNRVAILFNVEEGAEASIRSIRLIGNDNFTSWRLKREMQLEPKGLFNYFGDNYRYAEAKLEADLERIRTFYLEEGYLRFEVEARQVEVSVDKRHIDIVIRLDEGTQYALSEIAFAWAKDVTPPTAFVLEDFHEFVSQSVGDIYSGRESDDIIKQMTYLMGTYGHANAEVIIEPKINDDDSSVNITYLVNPNNIAYVRRINIIGNEFTRDEVIRRELLQFERERYSIEKVEQSRKRLNRLGYFSSASIETVPLPDSPSEVDLLVQIRESSTGDIRIGAGFSTDNNLSFLLGFTERNIFGTGNYLNTDLSISDTTKVVSFQLDERYHTVEGITRHSAVTYGESNSSTDSSAYTIDGYKGEFGYVVPLTDQGNYHAYVAYQQVKIESPEGLNAAYQPFVAKYGSSYDTVLADIGLHFDSRDTATAPTEGQEIDFSGEFVIPLLELSYFYLNYEHKYYKKLRFLPTDPIFSARFGAGYGDVYYLNKDEYPFYRRFHLGGSNTLRGFDTNSIGYADDSGGLALGGKTRVYGGIEISADADFFAFEEQQVFLVPFLDVGAVGKERKLGSFRMSGGVELRWISPIGPLRFSFVDTFRSKPGDNTRNFHFTVSTF